MMAASRHKTDATGKGAAVPLSLSQFKALVDADATLKTVSLDDVVRAYGVGKRSLLRYVANGDLKATRFGRKYVVTVAALREFLASNRMTKGPTAAGGRRDRKRRG